MWKRRSLTTLILSLAATFACGDSVEAPEQPAPCEGQLPNGSVQATVSADGSRSADFDLDCGQPEAPYGLFAQHAPLTQGQPCLLVIAVNEGQDWQLRLVAEADSLTAGRTYALIAEPDEGHGGYTAPLGPGGSFSAVSSGTIRLDRVETLELGPLRWWIIDGQATASFGAAESATIDFSAVPGMVNPGC